MAVKTERERERDVRTNLSKHKKNIQETIRTNRLLFLLHKEFFPFGFDVVSSRQVLLNPLARRLVLRVNTSSTAYVARASRRPRNVNACSRTSVYSQIRLSLNVRQKQNNILITVTTRTALSREHTSVKAADVAKLLLLNEQISSHVEYFAGVLACPT